jgi:hypothetical protein
LAWLYGLQFILLQNIGSMKTDKVIVKTPSGKEVEMLNEQEYFEKYTKGSRVSLPMPHDYNNWTFFLLKDNSIYDTLSEEDKKFIMNQQYEQYTTLWGKE